MDNTAFQGENLWIGQLGNLFVIISFVAAIVACVSYFQAARSNDELNSWKKFARSAFWLHSISVLGIAATLIYMLSQHLFEYHYVWQHSNTQMPIKYILSSLWEGQEGSFLLWSFWHIVLGNILMRSAGSWEAPVMTIFSSVQIFLSSMLLGIYIGDYNIGSNPFTILLREHPEFANLPFTQTPNYLESLDGRGLNPLLQNYWMTIHPPVLFLGFAATLIPFSYAIAALWKNKVGDWQAATLPWTFFGIMILGTGILMGGAWAYEALSFGGFWAWDPVENASLVPWLTLVASAHLMLINKNKKEGYLASLILTTVTFVLILYSTFLTRSGILGESSVHAFTDLGMSGQLLIYLLFYLILSVILLIVRRKSYNDGIKKEDETWSREFWMFVAALVLLVSAFQITYTTSIPVINKIFNTNMAPPSKPIDHYNKWQILFAILICVLMAVTQFMKYRKSEIGTVLKNLRLSFISSLLLSVTITLLIELYNAFYFLLLFSSLFALIANGHYIFKIHKGKFKKAGASIAHVGFALILLGVLISTGKQETISQNTSTTDVESLGEDFSNSKNILLSLNDTLRMGDYFVSYRGKEKEGVNIFFNVDYYQEQNGKMEHKFRLRPRVQTNPRMGNIAEPDTRHMFHKDIYTHIAYADLEMDQPSNGYTEEKTEVLSVGDTLFTSNSIVVLDSLSLSIDRSKYQLSDSSIAVAACLKAIDVYGQAHYAKPIFSVVGSSIDPIADNIEALGLRFNFNKIYTNTNQVEIAFAEDKSKKTDFIVMEATVFPGINILWTGCIIMVIGTIIAILQRLKSLKTSSRANE